MAWGGRKHTRVAFERTIDAVMIAIDGTWQNACRLVDISDGGARLVVSGPIDEMKYREFFLVLSQRTQTFRRCELVRVSGKELGVSFVRKNVLPSLDQPNGERRTASA